MGFCSDISTRWLFIHCFQIELEFRNVDFCGGRKTGEPGEKPSEQGENQQQTQPTYDAGSGNRTRDTLVGGERSHHCANPAPRIKSLKLRRPFPHSNKQWHRVEVRVDKNTANVRKCPPAPRSGSIVRTH